MNDETKTVDNMAIWNQASRTDPAATKPITEGYLKGKTAIAALLPVKMATEIFGPVGIGWGYEIIEERFDAGEHIYTTPKDGGEPLLLGIAQLHTMLVKVWANWNGEKLEATHYGHTPRLYRSKWGISTDDEYAKKSLSDAVKKALSMFGVNADIYLGEFDDQGYVDELRQDMAIEKADHKEAEVAKQRADYDEWKISNTKLMQEATQISMLEGLYVAAVRKSNRWNDTPYVLTVNEVWKERAISFVENAATLSKLEAIYKAAANKARGWNDENWKKMLDEKTQARKQALSQGEVTAA